MEKDRRDKETCQRSPHTQAEKRDEDSLENGTTPCKADDGGRNAAEGQSDEEGERD